MEVDAALQTMLDLLTQLNAAMHQLHIAGFNGDLGRLGPLRVQTECEVFAFKRKAKQKPGRPQNRFIFLFDGGILFCKKRLQAIAHAPEYYEYKMCISTTSLGFSETSRTGAGRFDIWDETKAMDMFAVQPMDPAVRSRWIQRLQKLTGRVSPPIARPARPHSWTSTVSNDSNASTRSSSGGETSVSVDSAIDPNGNQTCARPESPPADVDTEAASSPEHHSDGDNNMTAICSVELIPEQLQTDPITTFSLS